MGVTMFWKHKKKYVEKYYYDPQEDITAWELAQLLPFMINKNHDGIARLPVACLRHVKTKLVEE